MVIAVEFSVCVAPGLAVSNAEASALLLTGGATVSGFAEGFAVAVPRGTGLLAFLGSKPGGGMTGPPAPVVAVSVLRYF